MEKISKGRIPLFTILKVLIASYLITVVFLLILAALMYKMELGESIVDGGIVITYILSCFLGGFIMGKVQKTRKFIWGMIMGILYYAVLLAAAILMKQNDTPVFGNALTSMVMCVASGMLGGMMA